MTSGTVRTEQHSSRERLSWRAERHTREETMSSLGRPVAEERIERALLEQWDPLGVASTPGVHREYLHFAHELYNLLARGASDVQIARDLHHTEDADLGHPELVSRDLAPLVTELRTIERQL